MKFRRMLNIFVSVAYFRWAKTSFYQFIHMQNKNQNGLIYLHNYKSTSQPREWLTDERTLQKTLNRNIKNKMEKTSLVFLSTYMQTSNSILEEEPSFNHISQRSRDTPSPEPTLITNQFAFAAKTTKKKDKVLSYFQSNMKKVQSQERSITKLIDHVHRDHSNRRQIKTLAETLERNRTFTTMAIPSKESSNYINKIQNIKEMGLAFRDFVAKKNKKASTAALEKEPQQVFFNIDRKELLNKVNDTANLYSFVKDSKHRSRGLKNRENPSLCTSVNRRGITEPIELMRSRSRRRKETGFKWTLLGDKRTFNLKTTPCE